MILITTVGEDISLLEKFLFYYKEEFGFNDWFFIINNKNFSSINIKIKSLLYPFHSNIIEMKDDFTETKKIELENIIRQSQCNEWIMYADLDEFIYIPGGINNRIKLTEMYGFDYIEGLMVDRISSDFTLGDFNTHKSLESQYPIGCDITKSICGGWNKKIVLAKSNVKIGGGHHVIQNDVEWNNSNCQPYKEELTPWSYGIELHHFKWRSGLIGKMQKQMNNIRTECLHAWWEEMNKFVNHYKRFGKIDRFGINHYYIGEKIGI